ncbi:Uncharacterised protein [Bordetella pertussis]|mgnify:FL=1|uniref:DUF4055 domain-containing protein n=4 Tax=Bordetella pertussis TaxID=520 RepID=Q7VTW7_BORPE|nr:DUF4055 domain-containing protein [Bordetella pertussis]ETH38790.1 PF13264 domain protein [Bordetella pertussis H918]ETH45263.1 PF13264 domain protein [Bordetella pertussis H939]ETH49319.1 PF13264 domain protein [Bordetella pertussis H921]ETH70703.1 PF13264 domain protein [Bordetella pertussis STO1-CHLA-0011]ETH81885.1 PF13264 domain protein [Bordetella pertussis STO1-CHOC-0017]ETH86243.1 PF13264 domain protein [Bordetella pertussis STO1-CHOC-0018]ETH92937.1 PF13264 domain protein [Bordet
MPVDSKHPLWLANQPRWERCRTALQGRDAVHAAGEKYLPKLAGQDKAEYDAYKGRAMFYGATARTEEALIGMVFRKEPTVTLPAALQPMIEDADLAGTPVDTFIENVTKEVIDVTRVGVLVDYPVASGEFMTVGQAQAAGMRPYLATYKAEAIINWRTARVRGVNQLVLVVLAECYTDPKDEFTAEEKTQYRVLDLVDGFYRVRIYRTDLNTPAFEYTPMMNGKRLPYIPFVLIGRNGEAIDPQKPVLLDLVDVNMSHYRGTADYEHALHFTALPTAVVIGHELKEGQALKIGSSEAWVFTDPQADAKYLEFSGQGLDSIKVSLERKEGMMATLGARILAPEKRDAEAAETAKIHRAGENSVLGGIALGVGRSLAKAFRWAAEWAGAGSGTVEVKLNTEFFPAGLTAQDLTALVGALQAAAISPQTFYDNMRRGSIIDDGVTFEEEQDRIEAAGPALGTLGGQDVKPANGAV